MITASKSDTDTMELCVCAAIWYDNETWDGNQSVIVLRDRHHQCIAALTKMGLKATHGVQGFWTNRDRFVNREEGYRLQIAAGIPSKAEGGYRGSILFSEDLY